MFYGEVIPQRDDSGKIFSHIVRVYSKADGLVDEFNVDGSDTPSAVSAMNESIEVLSASIQKD